MFDKQVDNARANLSMGNISKFVIPLPPSAENIRITTKVNKLIAKTASKIPVLNLIALWYCDLYFNYLASMMQPLNRSATAFVILQK